jgi:hypothetical protein
VAKTATGDGGQFGNAHFLLLTARPVASHDFPRNLIC